MKKAASDIGVFLKRHPGPILIAAVMLAVARLVIVPALLHWFDPDPAGRSPRLEIVPLDPPIPSAQQS